MNSNKRIVMVYIVLAVVTLAVFWQVHQYDFVNIDDNKYVTENIHVQSGITWEGFRWAFSTTFAQYWHPLTWISLMIDYQLYDLNAGGYHVNNLILHILSTLLLFWLFNRMTGELWKSAFVAAFFALHPLRVESVAWIAKRRDVLCIFFSILTLCLYVYYTEKPVMKRYLLTLLTFILSLTSKPMTVTLPLIMILLDYWPLGRFQPNKSNIVLCLLREKSVFFILSIIFSMITIHARYNGENPFENHFPISTRLVNAPISFATYLEKTFWPHDMTVPSFSSFYLPQISAWQFIGISLLLIVISVAVIIFMKRFPYLFVGWLWFSLTVSPVLGIIPFGNIVMTDHHTYLPSIGIAIGLAWGIPLLFTGNDIRKIFLLPVSIAVLIILTALTWKQCGYWKNSVELFKHACLVIPQNNHCLYNNFASALAEKGNMEEAIDNYSKAIVIRPDLHLSYIGRGLAYERLGQHQLATKDFNQAIRLKPDDAKAYFDRGNLYDELGQYRQAIKDYNEAIRLNPDYIQAYNNRGNTYFSIGNYVLGCADAQKACEMGNCRLLKQARSQKRCNGLEAPEATESK